MGPITPPDVQVRIRRFVELSRRVNDHELAGWQIRLVPASHIRQVSPVRTLGIPRGAGRICAPAPRGSRGSLGSASSPERERLLCA
ncbi:MAG: hypothetical protein Q8R28_15925 [Dehalococcoidia bacterium]|nr:hypothetical protein [Dehalococcoidia bacterium]